MRVLIAGATGAIGKPLLSCLMDAGHELFALVRSRTAAGTREATRAQEVVADALDAASVLELVQHTKPDVIVNELTALPKHYTPEEMKVAAARDKEVRVKGNANLLAAARATNCRRYVLQSSGFWYAPGDQDWPMKPPRLRLRLRLASLPDAGPMPIWRRRHRTPGSRRCCYDTDFSTDLELGSAERGTSVTRFAGARCR